MNAVSKNTRDALGALRQFFLDHGHVHIPNFPAYESLFNFCNTLRASRSRLPAEIVKELDSMGFRWDMHLSNELRWHYHYAELKTYYNQFGHTRISAKKGEYKILGAWILRQRSRAALLSPEQKRLLNKIRFLWGDDVKREKEQYWKSMFKKLKTFYSQHGHSNVPDRYKPDEKLGRWVSTVRYSEDHLDAWKRKLLKTVNFKFRDDIRKDKGNHRKNLFNKLKAFYKMHGHANVPETYTDHKLSIFVAYLRQHPERISRDEKKQLKSWNFLFSEDIKEKWEKLWRHSFTKLEKFKKKYGHCRVSSAFEDQPLARWVANQRKDKKDGKLPTHREKKLRAMGFSFYEDIAELQEKKWQKMYARLTDFKKVYGNTVVMESYKDKKLVNWVLHQRQAKDRMPEERRKLLTKIGFVWKAR